MINKNIIKLSLVTLLSSSLFAGEIQVGNGTFEMTGGFIGLDKTISTDVTTYSFVEQHAPLFGSKSWFYKYNLSWYDSDTMVQAQSEINSALNNSFFNSVSPITIPSIDYRLQGLDVNLVLGKDIYHQDENNYIGLGAMVGVSLPWIDSKKNTNNKLSIANDSMNMMKKTKTKIYTYKIGPSITGRKSLNNYFSVYGSGTYAYQTGTFKNDIIDTDLNVNGKFQEYDVGLRFQPVSTTYKTEWFTLSPKLYATIGYRYTNWDLDDVNIDITGMKTKFTAIDFNMNSSITYFGLGYSF